MSDLIASGLTTASIIGLAVIVTTIALALQPPEEEYEAPIGDPIDEPDDEKRERERKESEYPTKALDRGCASDSEASSTGRFGGPPSGPFDRIHCDRGRVEHDRKDYTGIFWFPPSKCKGDLFKPPGSCSVSSEEVAIREKIRRDGPFEYRNKGVSGRLNLNLKSQDNNINFRNTRNGR